VFRSHSFPLPSPLFSLPYLFLSPLPLRSRTSSTNTAATTRQSFVPLLRLVLVSLFHINKFLLISPVRPVRGRVPLLPLHRYLRHRHSTYNTSILYLPSCSSRKAWRSNQKFAVLFSISPVCSRLDIRLCGIAVRTVSTSVSPPSQAFSASFSPSLLLSPLFRTASPLSRPCYYLLHHLSQT
jgi:hypothetical protein